jgi:site-specific recombinase XerD
VPAEDVRRLLATSSGAGFRDRRDQALILLLFDTGLRVSELVGLRWTPEDPDANDIGLDDAVVRVYGKAARSGGPRERLLPLGRRSIRALDRYLRVRRSHPDADLPSLWLGQKGRVTDSGVRQIIESRCKQAGPSSRG